MLVILDRNLSAALKEMMVMIVQNLKMIRDIKAIHIP
jgi:hypothetical protein